MFHSVFWPFFLRPSDPNIRQGVDPDLEYVLHQTSHEARSKISQTRTSENHPFVLSFAPFFRVLVTDVTQPCEETSKEAEMLKKEKRGEGKKEKKQN